MREINELGFYSKIIRIIIGNEITYLTYNPIFKKNQITNIGFSFRSHFKL